MSRPLRLAFAGGLYHIFPPGDRREDIYVNDSDRSQWLALFGQVCKRYNWRCPAYCLMDNHYHIVVESIEGNLHKGCDSFTAFTLNISRTHHRIGHVFQGRYKGILVDKDSCQFELATVPP